ncbi:MAG: PKD domain-containing protein, partial [Bacteroidetes bacterium]|nr:PKD domain-containing protein [Bacteroidota bacterium]MBU1578107.1 PKD domain-containing protein [Bacteroidota bacterium]
MKTKSFFAVLFGILTISVLVFHACKKEQKDPSPPTYTDGQGEIGQLGGTITIDDASSPLNGVTIIVPEDALQVNTLIQIVSAPDTVSFPGGSTQPIVQLLPDGLSFQEPITITMPFVSSNPNNIGLYYYDPSEELIEELEDVTINVQEGLISGLTNHFSYYTAADKEVKATINMFRTQEGVIGVRLDIYGTNNVELGLKWIPTTWWHKVQTLDQELNIWQVLTNPGGPHDGNVYSIFDVYLREGELIGSDPVSASHFSIIREENDPFKVKIIQRFPTNELYSSGFLHTEDIESNMSEMDYKNLGNWINGEPLIFLFDGFVPNPDKKYFVKMEWVLASELNASPLFNYSPIYKLHNKPDKRKLNQMSLTSMDQIDVDNNYIIDEFQVWGLNTAPVCNFTVDKPNASVGELIQFNDFSEYTPTSWQWDFGDGITSAQKDPTHSYSSPGTYTVSLEVTNAYGSDNETMDINVTEATFIAIVTPNGDEEWMIGSEQTISWDDNIDQDVKITLLQNNLPTLTIAESTASNGNFVWTIPNTVQAGTDYKIHIASTTNMSVYDNSNDFFTILEQGNIIVTKPNAGTIWTMGQYNVPIEW